MLGTTIITFISYWTLTFIFLILKFYSFILEKQQVTYIQTFDF